MSTCFVLGSGVSTGFGLPTFVSWMDRLREISPQLHGLADVCEAAYPGLDMEAIYQILKMHADLGIDAPLPLDEAIADADEWTMRLNGESFRRLNTIDALDGLIEHIPHVLYCQPTE